MFQTYIKTAIRNLLKHKNSAVINIAGLTVGLAAFLLIFLVIQYEKSFDTFHSGKENIYRVVRIGRQETNREYRTGVPFPVTQGIRNDLPQLKKTAAVYQDGNVQVNVLAKDGTIEKKFKEKSVFVAEPEFFEMFEFPLVKGNIKTALKDINTVLITKEIAAKYFSDWTSAMGKTISLYGEPMQITGILENPPPNTDFALSIVVSYATLMHFTDPNDWGSISDQNYCFVQLNDKTPLATVTNLLNQFTDKRIKPVNPGYFLSLQPLKELHYDKKYGNFSGRVFSKEIIQALQVIAIFLLVIACINFINITTAQAINRAREVGVRKVLGSSKQQLVVQFLGETGITTLLALVLAIFIAVLCMPFLNQLLGIKVSATHLAKSNFIIYLFLAFAGVSFLSGFYPALVLSAFKSIQVLKSSPGNASVKGISLRRGLVIFQFVIAQSLIVGTLIVAAQMNYFKTADLGFNQKAIIHASFPTDSLSRTKTDLLKYQIQKTPGVKQVSFSVFTPAGGGDWATDLNTPDNNKPTPTLIVQMKPADTAFFSLYDLKMVAGRSYFPSDTMREFVVNETLIRSLGLNSPDLAIGKQVKVAGKMGTIVGVVKDFHNFSLRDAISPTVMTTQKRNYRVANVQVDMGQSKQVIAALQDIWQKQFPDFVFEYQFLDQTLSGYYKQENQLAGLYKVFAAIAIFISCLGLYGLISFVALQRKKEIGIRKVLGAPVQNIVMLLSKEFTILISIAFLISAPVAWYFMHEWLQQYAYRITIGAGFFAATIAGSLLIAWITVGYTTIRAALANPVKALRTE